MRTDALVCRCEVTIQNITNIAEKYQGEINAWYRVPPTQDTLNSIRVRCWYVIEICSDIIRGNRDESTYRPKGERNERVDRTNGGAQY